MRLEKVTVCALTHKADGVEEEMGIWPNKSDPMSAMGLLLFASSGSFYHW